MKPDLTISEMSSNQLGELVPSQTSAVRRAMTALDVALQNPIPNARQKAINLAMQASTVLDHVILELVELERREKTEILPKHISDNVIALRGNRLPDLQA